uniref:Uncharacterized protein n=1 Tax=Kalanchoe fedtschenkoi TaxID=63787 RepID=A0A7N0T6U3_KALFE
MAKLLLLLAVLLPALAAARHVTTTRRSLTVSGRAYCDNCQAGFETPVTQYIQGAKVKIECTSRKTNRVSWTSEEATTDSTGTYHIKVDEEYPDHTCDVVLVSSPVAGCSKADPARDRARVILFRNNGMVSDDRVANNVGFMSDEPLAACAQVMQQYQLADEDV